MDRLLDALANDERRAILECLLKEDRPLEPAAIRHRMRIPFDRRAHFSRQVKTLYSVGVLERTGSDEYVVAERDIVDLLLQQVANAEAALDARRAEVSAQAAKNRVREGTRRRTTATGHGA